jgi:DNA-binding NarL/FixJ family response regulator
MQNQKSALIVTRSVKLRESLLVLLRAIPRAGAIHQAEDGPSALGMGLGAQSALVLLDCTLPDEELPVTLGQMKAAWPQARYIVFLDDEDDRQRAEEAGADVVLVKGVRAATVLETIESLLLGKLDETV